MVTRPLCMFLFVGSLIQVIGAAPTPIVIAQYIPKFLSLSGEVIKTVANGTEQILHIQSEIKSVVDAAQTTVDKQLAELKNFVNQSKITATKRGANITSCVSEEEYGINHTHFKILENCRIRDGTKRLYIHALKLAKEEVSLSITVKWCIIKNPIDGYKLKMCFDDKIEDVRNKIAKFKKEITATAPEAVEFSNACTKNHTEALNAAIHNIMGNFKNCVDEIINI